MVAAIPRFRAFLGRHLASLSVRKQLLAGAIAFQLLLLTVTIASAISLSGSSGVLNTIVNDTVVRIGRLNQILDLINARESHLATVLATTDELVAQEETERYAESVKELNLALRKLEENTPEDRKEHLKQLNSAIQSLAELEQLFQTQLNAKRKVEAEVVFVRGIHSQAEAARESLRTYMKAEEGFARNESVRQANRNIITLRIIIVLTIVCLLASTVVSFALTRSVGRAFDLVESLRLQQDGDYFLTALLQGQLTQGNTESPFVRMKSRILQYKNFKFKDKGYSIGGDFCFGGNIKLKNRSYAVFLNADAMGKSMQGAGGALILGALFRAILERTWLASAMRDIYPERWLKNAFTEIQSVFAGFEGSMLVSLILGLVDEQSGTLYYLNAAHPFPVLYRNGCASFIQETHHLHKAGTPDLAGNISVRTAQLQVRDVLVLGSDGRDEIRLKGEDAYSPINMDETKFLQFVEAGQGDIERIEQKILEVADLTDDLSLMQIDILSIDQEKANRTSEFRDAAANFAKAGNFKDAATQLAQLVDNAPSVRDLFACSYYLRKAGRLAEAADLGERLRLRRPEITRNLLHLSRIYLALGEPSRAIALAEEARAHGDDPRVTRIIELARSRSPVATGHL